MARAQETFNKKEKEKKRLKKRDDKLKKKLERKANAEIILAKNAALQNQLNL